MAGYDSRGFEIPQRFDLRGYPKPRAKRTGPLPTPPDDTLTGASQAFTRVWSGRMRTGIPGTITRIVSPAMSGPAILDTLVASWNGSTTAALNPSWQLGWTDTRIAEQLDATPVAIPPGTAIFETSHQDDTPKTLPLGFGTEFGLGAASNNQNTPWNIRLRYPIRAQTFYLWAVTNAVQNANFNLEITVNIICLVSDQALLRLGA